MEVYFGLHKKSKYIFWFDNAVFLGICQASYQKVTLFWTFSTLSIKLI